MKHPAHFLSFVLLLLAMDATADAQKKDKKEQEYQAMIAVIDAGSYAFEVQNILPTGGRNIRPTTIYTLQVRDGHVRALLPYFGRAYSPSYGGDGGINLDGKAENLEISRNDKKMNILIKFDIKGDGDSYQVSLNVTRSGFASLSIIPTRRQPIGYSGLLSALSAE